MQAYQLTAYDTRSSLINTNIGYIKYEDWCNKEIKRINVDNPERDARLIARDGKIAIIVEFKPSDRFEYIDMSGIADKYLGRSRL